MEHVYNFLNKLNINKDDKLIIAVSFGPDSMFLLDLLKNKYNKNNIICAHVHHNHRKENDIEAEKLKEYCGKNNITFEFMKIETYKNNNFTEEEARNRRYLFFEQLLEKYSAKYLFTAHHGDDLTETILMKIVRGSSLKGYSGINLISKRDNYKIIRPLLYLTKDYILEHCNLNKIPYAIDISNNDLIYTRNRYRKNILPFLKEENNNVHIKFLEFSNNINEYYNYVNKQVEVMYNECVINNIINANKIKEYEDLIIKKIMERYLFEYYGNNINLLTSTNLNDILNLVKSNKSNVSISLPLKINLVKSYNKIFFDKVISYNSYCFTFCDELNLPDGYVIRKIDYLKSTTNYYTALDSSEIKLPLKIRNKHIGDKMDILNLDGSKKLKDIFIDEKIPISKRDIYPVVVDSSDNIVWLPGIKKSKYDKSKSGKYDIILEYVKEDLNETK